MTAAKDQIQALKRLLTRGELRTVFQQLPALFPADAPEVSDLIILEGQFIANQRDERLGTVPREDLQRTKAQLSASILTLISTAADREDGSTLSLDTSFRDQLRSIRALFIDADKLSHAFSRLERLLEEQFPEQMPLLSPLWADFNTNRNAYQISQTIDRATYMLTFRRVVKGLEELLLQLTAAEAKVTGQGVQWGSELAKVNCDRKKILRRFLRTFEENEAAGVPQHTYLLSYQKYGQAVSLARRLVTQLKQQYGKVKYNGFQQIPIHRIDVLSDDDLEGAKFSLRKGFNRGLKPEVRRLAELLQDTKQKYPKLSRYTYWPFVLHVQIPEATWAEVGAAAIQWFVEEFCRCEERQQHIPVCFLILDIQESKKSDKRPTGLRALFGRKKEVVSPPLSSFAALERVYSTLPKHVTLLPPLRRVSEMDLHDWYSEYESNERQREAKVKAMVQELGDSPGGWHMTDVEALLGEIIESYQNAAHNI